MTYKVIHNIMHTEVFYIEAQSKEEAIEISMSGNVEATEVMNDDTLQDATAYSIPITKGEI